MWGPHLPTLEKQLCRHKTQRVHSRLSHWCVEPVLRRDGREEVAHWLVSEYRSIAAFKSANTPASLTCRQRKLKCDELKPVCGQCTKANRNCQPSDTITFRHQHNPSMNANENGSTPEQGQPLASFYAYKNTFEASTQWVDVPQKRKHSWS